MSPLLPSLTLLLCAAVSLTGCGTDDAASSAPAPEPSSAAATGPTADEQSESEELRNPCDPEAPAEDLGLEGSPAPAGARIIAVTSLDHAFVGVPTRLEPGAYGFTLTGGDEELHELALVRRLDDRPVEEAAALPGREQRRALEYLGGVTACPGETSPDPVGGVLGPGSYALICFIPLGTTTELEGEALLEAYGNDPHYTVGEVAVFEVG